MMQDLNFKYASWSSFGSDLPCEFILSKTNLLISSFIIGMVNKVLGCSDEKTIEKLLWVAVMFPEI